MVNLPVAMPFTQYPKALRENLRTGQAGDQPAFNISGSNEVEKVRYVEETGSRTGVSPVHKEVVGNSDATREGSTGPPTTPQLRRRRRHLPHWERAGATYFITFRLQEGQLAEDERQIVLSSCLYWNSKKWSVYGVVVMPDHVHTLAQPLPLPGSTGGTPVVLEGWLVGGRPYYPDSIIRWREYCTASRVIRPIP